MADSTYIYILASKGISFVSTLIRWYQFGFPYTHIAYVTNYDSPDFEPHNPQVIEAWLPKVRFGYFAETHTPGTEFTVFRLKVTQHQKEVIENFLYNQIGRPYDLIGLLAFLTRIKKVAKNNFWFCSELVFRAIKEAGISLLKYTDPEEVSPALFLKSPLLEKVYDSYVPGNPKDNGFFVKFTLQFG